jgi:hypothetical protein
LAPRRLDLPLLPTDADAELRAARRRWDAPLGRWVRDLPTRAWPVDERAGEGLAWPQGLEGFCRRAEEGMWREKVSVSRGAVRYLVGIMEDKGDVVAAWPTRKVDWACFLSLLERVLTCEGIAFRDPAFAAASALAVR